MSKSVVSLIKEDDEIKDALKQNDFIRAYKLLGANEATASMVGEFTEMCYKAGIDPLKYMEYVPSYYLHNAGKNFEIVIPNNISSVYSWAFRWSDIYSVFIPDSVFDIAGRAFANAVYLERVRFDERNRSLLTIPEACFINDESLKEVILPDNIEYIEKLAFASCDRLHKIRIPDTIKKIDDLAFHGTILLQLEVPESFRKNVEKSVEETGNVFGADFKQCNVVYY